jgi:hypothetical protein
MEHRLRVFENRVLRRIFGPKRDGETGDWRKVHNEELHNLSIHFPVYKCLERRKAIICGNLGTHKLLVLCLLHALCSGLHTVRVSLLRSRLLLV